MPTETIEELPEIIVAERDAPVFDADAEKESDKNRRIAKELFPDNEDEGEVKAEKDLPQPPAQRRRQSKAELSEIGSAPREAPKERVRAPDGKFVKTEAEVQTEAIPQADGAPAEVAPVVDDNPVVDLEWTAYGEQVSIPGAKYKPGHGVFIPETEIANVRRSWAQSTRYPKLVDQNAELRANQDKLYSRKEAEADAVLQIVGQHFKTPQSLHAFAQQVLNDPERIAERLAFAIEKKQWELGQNVVEPLQQNAEPEPAEIAESLTDEFERFIRADPELKGTWTPAEQRNIMSNVFKNAPIFLTKVDRDYDIHGNPVVSAEQKVEVRKGEILVNRTALLTELRLAAQEKKAGTRTGTPRQEGGRQSIPPVRRQAPPSAAGRTRATAGSTASQPSRGRQSDTIPNHSVSAAAKWLFDE